jgi:hypothetical protein
MSKKLLKILFLSSLIFLSSCTYSFFDYYSNKSDENCQEIKSELESRYKLFKKLSQDEIKKRNLINPSSALTKSILFMYSMETFLPYNLNKAERDRDPKKVMSLGPFARALYLISFGA